MAIAALILGALTGTVSALAGWVFFGLGGGTAVALYFAIGLGLPLAVMALAARRPRRRRDAGTRAEAATPETA
jgi:hypothetical protein